MAMLDVLLLGRLTGSPEGVTNEEVSIKKISSRKMISAIEEKLKEVSILFRGLRFMGIFS
jgi:hypothetical protein